jgi:hypothetical protein
MQKLLRRRRIWVHLSVRCIDLYVLIRLKQLVELYILFIIRISAPRSDFVFVIRTCS